MRLFVPLTMREFDALAEIARAERRRPQEQAAAMLSPLLARSEATTHPAPAATPAPARNVPERREAARGVA